MNSTPDFRGRRPNDRAISASPPFTNVPSDLAGAKDRTALWAVARGQSLSHPAPDKSPSRPLPHSALPAQPPRSSSGHSSLCPTSPPPSWLPGNLLTPLEPPPPLRPCGRRRTPSGPSSWTVAAPKVSAVVWEGDSTRRSGSSRFILPRLLLHVTIPLRLSPSDNTCLPSAFQPEPESQTSVHFPLQRAPC